MPLHMLKLCVGATSVADLQAWTRQRAEAKKLGASGPLGHATRMTPKRADELLDGGSLYWVIKGQIAARQRLVGLEPIVGADNVRRCVLLLDDEIVLVQPRPFRAFQGWRYLTASDAPPDLAAGGGEIAEMPEEMRRELGDLGLL